MNDLAWSLERLNEALEGRYSLVRVLGRGGMATVFVARDLRHDRQVALKVLEPGLARAVGPSRFLQEIRLTANLQHPHILPLFDSGEADGALYYVMPLVAGESLRDRLTRERVLPIDAAVRITRQVAGALDYAHRREVIHRDIKPANILLQEGEALLADFGVAVALAEPGGDRLTVAGLSVGTPTYMSPEQAAGERDLDARSDIYSLGTVAYEMLAGEPPVAGASARVVIARLMTERPTALHLVREGVPAYVEAAVMRALAKEPADRFASASEFADALVSPPTGGASSARRGEGAASGTAEGLDVGERVRASGGAGRARRWRSAKIAGLAVLAAVAIAVIARYGASAGPTSAPNEVGTASIRSIAVLPLDNYSGDPAQDYFAEGITDELTAVLATISELRVTSRGSAMQFQGRDRPPTPQVARALKVDAVVEGSVVRVGDRVRITAQLIDGRTDRHLWARSFERTSTDVLALQADLASAIAQEINVRLTESEQSRLKTAPAVDPGAYDAYLRGRYFFNRPSDENLRRAVQEFERAVALDSTFAAAYSGLSDAYLWAGYNEGFMTASAAKPRARQAAERAVALDPSSAEAHTSLAVFRLFYERDWAGSEAAFRRAIALNPSYAYAHDQFALGLAFTGRFEESESASRRAAELDPLSPQVLIDATVAPLFQRDTATADSLARRALELDPSYFFPVMIRGWGRLEIGAFAEAVPFLEEAETMGAPPFVTAFLAYAYGMTGDGDRAEASFEALRDASPEGDIAPFNLALVHLGLGEHDLAIAELERARDADSQFLCWLGQDHIFDPLRSEPRFIALLRELNFVE